MEMRKRSLITFRPDAGRGTCNRQRGGRIFRVSNAQSSQIIVMHRLSSFNAA